MNSCFRISGDFLYLDIKAIPGSSKSAIGEVKDDRLKVHIASVPEDGRANEELRSFLAKSLGLAKKDVVLEAGEKSRLKTIRLPATAEGKLRGWVR